MNADRLARLDGADDDGVRLDLDHFTEMHAPRPLVSDEIAEADLTGETGDGVMSRRDRLDMAARRDAGVRLREAPDEARHGGERRRALADRQRVGPDVAHRAPPSVLMASLNVVSLSRISEVTASKARETVISCDICWTGSTFDSSR